MYSVHGRNKNYLDIAWEECYILSDNKEHALLKLSPTTPDYYFYTILHLLTLTAVTIYYLENNFPNFAFLRLKRLKEPATTHNQTKIESLIADLQASFPKCDQVIKIQLRMAITNYFSQTQARSSLCPTIMKLLNLQFPTSNDSKMIGTLTNPIEQNQNFHFKTFFKHPSSVSKINIAYVNIILEKLQWPEDHLAKLLS